MLECERAYFENTGVASIDMMEQAAHALLRHVIALAGGQKRVYFACGPGGNGGDGYACARLWHAMGGSCRIFEAMPPRAADAIENRDRAAEAGIPIHNLAELDRFPAPEVWVDALYGTGLSRAPEGAGADLILRMNSDRGQGAKVIAADIPSGLNGATGARCEPCVQADETVAFELAKFGHFLQDGLDMCGEVHIAPIGFADDAFESENPEDLCCLFTPQDLRCLFPPRTRNSYKNVYGHLLIVAGSFGMAGAAALCAQAALRSGAGLVSIACPESIVPILQVLAPCAMCIPLKESGGAIGPGNEDILHQALSGKTAVAIGCGLTQRVPEEIIRIVLESGLPAVIDADAINIISGSVNLRALLRSDHILTPHPGEAARLLGRRVGDPIGDARELARLGANVVLKGASRVVAGGRTTLVSASGSCGMARGGSGDVFTGILGAMLAATGVGKAAYSAMLPMLAAAACEIHGLCGEMAQAKYGPRAANSADLIKFLPEVFQKYVD